MLFKLKSAFHETLILIGYKQFALYFYLREAKSKLRPFGERHACYKIHYILTMRTFHESKIKFCNRVALST